MSYTSESRLPSGASLGKVKELVNLLGYHKEGKLKSEKVGSIECYHWFDKKDFRSWVGVELSIYTKDGLITVGTRTNASRSYYDLTHQNKTIRLFRKFFGGSFQTDEGTNRYFHPSGGPTTTDQSGCYLAFHRFQGSLHRLFLYVTSRDFKWQHRKLTGIYMMDAINPWILSNHFFVIYAIFALEDYFKSTYVSLLICSDKKESIMKSARIPSDRLIGHDRDENVLEEAFADSLSFQRVSNACKHFTNLDKRLDFAGLLRKSYRNRKKSIYETLEELNDMRNEIVHRGAVRLDATEDHVKDVLSLMKVGVDRIYANLALQYKWNI